MVPILHIVSVQQYPHPVQGKVIPINSVAFGCTPESRLIFWTPAFVGVTAPASAISAVKHSAGDFALTGFFLC
jgi:hypothetical protein